MPALPSELPVLRRQLESLARRWGLTEDETFRLLIVVNELVSNVIDHARTSCRVTVRLAESGLRVLVTDYSQAPPQLAARDLQTIRGHGLHLIDGLAAQWGWATHAQGKTVWASIAHAQP